MEFLESKLKSKNSSDSREKKWNEFQSIIRLQEKIIAEKFLTKTILLDCNSFNTESLQIVMYDYYIRIIS